MIYKAIFLIFLTGCKLFATIKILIVLLVTNLTCITNSRFSTKKLLFFISMFTTKISSVTTKSDCNWT